MSGAKIYAASPVKQIRRRATGAEMEERAEFLIPYAEKHGPVTVRGLYYQAEVHSVPGIGKDESGYAKVQTQVLALRRKGRLRYQSIADATRWMRKPKTHNSVQDALLETARLYRKSLWSNTKTTVEVWVEKDAVAGVIYPVTASFDVPLMVPRGFSSETFCFEAVEALGEGPRLYKIYYLGDFDRAGQDAARSLHEKLERFAHKKRGILVHFESLAVTEAQIIDLRLPTREPKRKTEADKKWPFEFACELDAIPPDHMRGLVQAAIERHLPADQFNVLKAAEQSERAMMRGLVAMAVAVGGQ